MDSRRNVDIFAGNAPGWTGLRFRENGRDVYTVGLNPEHALDVAVGLVRAALLADPKVHTGPTLEAEWREVPRG